MKKTDDSYDRDYELSHGCGHDHHDSHGHGHNHEDSHEYHDSHAHGHDRGNNHESLHAHGHNHEDSHDHHDSHAHGHNHEGLHAHGHDHESLHDHGHVHGDHSHHHEHHTEKVSSVSVYTHEMAVVGSVRCRIGKNYEDALEYLQSCMKKAAKFVEEAGGLIGHVKAYAKEEARSCMISITEDEDVQRKDIVGKGIYVESASIVFGVTTEELEKILREAFAEFLA